MKIGLKHISYLVLCFCWLNSYSQIEIRNLDEFTSIHVSEGIVVNLINGTEHKAIIEVSKGNIDELLTEVQGDGTLRIRWEQNKKIINNRQAVLDLHQINLNKIRASSGATIKTEECITTEDLYIKTSSGASVKLDLTCINLSLKTSSGAYISLEGTATNQTVSASSGASYKGKDLITENTEASASSGASISVYVVQSFDASASSGGVVRYGGNPERTDINVGKYSGGMVKKI